MNLPLDFFDISDAAKSRTGHDTKPQQMSVQDEDLAMLLHESGSDTSDMDRPEVTETHGGVNAAASQSKQPEGSGGLGDKEDMRTRQRIEQGVYEMRLEELKSQRASRGQPISGRTRPDDSRMSTSGGDNDGDDDDEAFSLTTAAIMPELAVSAGQAVAALRRRRGGDTRTAAISIPSPNIALGTKRKRRTTLASAVGRETGHPAIAAIGSAAAAKASIPVVLSPNAEVVASASASAPASTSTSTLASALTAPIEPSRSAASRGQNEDEDEDEDEDGVLGLVDWRGPV